MLVGMRTYKRSYPTTDVLLFEPDRGDDEMFFKNVFRYADRKRLAEHAYQRTRRDLYSHADALEPLLARMGSACAATCCRTARASSATREGTRPAHAAGDGLATPGARPPRERAQHARLTREGAGR